MSFFLHAQRIDVLHALALIAGGRESLPDGLERLAEGDPLLAPWVRRLAPPLRAGEALPEVLRRARLVSRTEGAALAAESDAVAGLARLAETAAAPVRGLALVRWFPTVLVTVASAACAIGMLSNLFTLNMQQELGLRGAGISEALLSLIMAVLAIFMLQVILAQIRGLRHIQHVWCPEVHRAAAWRDFVETVRFGDEPVRLGPVASAMVSTGLLAQRHRAPVWDQPWRTWLMLSRFRLSAEFDQRLITEPSGQLCLDALGGADRVACDAALREAIRNAMPLLTAALWLVGAACFVFGMAGPLFSIIEQLNSGGG